MPKGKLTLIPTPLDNSLPLHPSNLKILEEACLKENSIFLMEEPKTSRRRWISWGLDREFIDQFRYFNEHNQSKDSLELIHEMKQGKNVFLMSDEGMPVFCDPGTELVNLCHQENVEVDCGVFCNSLILALSLSGFKVDKFSFLGFPPVKSPDRGNWLEKFSSSKDCVALMDTAYRLNKTLEELSGLNKHIQYFLGCDLNREGQVLLRGNIDQLIKSYDGGKRDFVLIKQPHVGDRKKKR